MIVSNIPLLAIGAPSAPWLQDEPELTACPLCDGTGHGLGEYTHEMCPACHGLGEVEISEAELITSRYISPEYYWGIDSED
ncbi:MAG: hypothetical protein J6U49_01035 [Alistipes sp.]|nr:hypothetical protein [Alistipes sp.]